MKKIFLATVLTAASLSVNAQEGISKSKFFDNWQVGVNVGGYTPTHSPNGFFKSTRPNFGLEVGKQLSPGFRLGAEGTAYINNNSTGVRNPLAIEHTNVAILGTFNLSNIFAGYKGTPRKFEVEAFAGPGWFHSFVQEPALDNDRMTAKFGANFLLNLGTNKAWGIKFSPSILYFVDNPATNTQNSLNSKFSFTQASLGIVYRFKGSNGAHHITNVENKTTVVDNSEELDQKERELKNANAKIARLESDLEAAKSRKPASTTTTITKTKRTLESVVTFRQGKSTIDAAQLPNVERIASYMKKHKNSEVLIKGFASPEGNADINARIAKARAEAVKSMLVSKYKIEASRITAEGNGVGDMFTEPDWNRVSIATIKD